MRFFHLFAYTFEEFIIGAYFSIPVVKSTILSRCCFYPLSVLIRFPVRFYFFICWITKRYRLSIFSCNISQPISTLTNMHLSKSFHYDGPNGNEKEGTEWESKKATLAPCIIFLVIVGNLDLSFLFIYRPSLLLPFEAFSIGFSQKTFHAYNYCNFFRDLNLIFQSGQN